MTETPSLEEVRQARRAQLERYRDERLRMLHLIRNRSAALFWAVISTLAVPVLAAASYYSVAMWNGSRVYHPTICLPWLALLALPVSMIIVRRYRITRRNRITTTLKALADSYEGKVHAQVGPSIDWLNRYWAGPYDLANINYGRYYHVVTLSINDYPVALELDPVPYDGELEPRADIFVACTVPIMPDAGASTLKTLGEKAETFVSSIEEDGFRVELTDGGLCARAKPQKAKQLTEPFIIASLEDTMVRLVKAAVFIGAGPVEPS